MNLYLCGFQGAGKTHFGRILSKALQMPFYDVDQELIQQFNSSTIKALYQDMGKETFRKEEEHVVEKLTQKKEAVIALGGGSLESESSQTHIAASGTLFYLYRSLEETRPKIMPAYIEEPFELFFERRHAIFSKLAHHIVEMKQKR